MNGINAFLLQHLGIPSSQSPVVEPKREGQRKDVEKTKETKSGVITSMKPKNDSSTKMIQ
ncbi:unnamed protein product [Orchesella dallaii]|uniref:Uncharacterized protein n=1 Tax=Orchesella dallaii TaxID=48710 RepID=A0ABP1QP23_9HEXA